MAELNSHKTSMLEGCISFIIRTRIKKCVWMSTHNNINSNNFPSNFFIRVNACMANCNNFVDSLGLKFFNCTLYWVYDWKKLNVLARSWCPKVARSWWSSTDERPENMTLTQIKWRCGKYIKGYNYGPIKRSHYLAVEGTIFPTKPTLSPFTLTISVLLTSWLLSGQSGSLLTFIFETTTGHLISSRKSSNLFTP